MKKDDTIWHKGIGLRSVIIQPLSVAIIFFSFVVSLASGLAGGGDGPGIGDFWSVLSMGLFIVSSILWFTYYIFGIIFVLKNRKFREKIWYILMIYNVLGIFPLIVLLYLILSPLILY